MSVDLISPAGSLVTAPEALAEKLVAQGFTYAAQAATPKRPGRKKTVKE